MTDDWSISDVRALDGAGTKLLDSLRDPRTGAWMTPVSSGGPEDPWPPMPDEPSTAESPLFAVLDTGIVREHPLLADLIEDEKDFTGEGRYDGTGHGTVVALLGVGAGRRPQRVEINNRGKKERLIVEAAWVNRFREENPESEIKVIGPSKPTTPLLIAKVIDSSGAGSPEALIAGIDWVAAYKRAHPDRFVAANLSVGVYSRRVLSLLPCNGGCDVCKAAVRLAEAGVFVVAAAGNLAGQTSCPAMVARYRPGIGIMAVAGTGYVESGKGTISASGWRVSFQPIS